MCRTPMPWFVLETDEKIDLEKTFYSGQIFSFKKTGPKDYSGVINRSIITFRQVGDLVEYEFHEEIQKILYHFFTLDINYKKLIEKWNKSQNQINFKYNGLRLLRCSFIETIFSFICASNNNIKRITSMIDYLFSKGEFLGCVGDIKFYEFPDTHKLIGIEEELRKKKFGYRSKFICSSAKKLSKTSFPKNIGYEDAVKTLMKLDGIGRKVADCICLLSLNHLSSVPVDTHIFKISKKIFGLEGQLNNRIYNFIKERYIKLFGEYAGIAQLFIFKQILDKEMQ